MTKPIKLNYAAFGEDVEVPTPPVIILHGLFGSSRNWQTFAQKLSENFCVYALDLRNHGNSPHTDTMSYQEMAADVVQFMDEHNLDCARLIGHSMGGKTAMAMAMDSPQRIDHLVIVDIAPVAYEHNYDELLGKLRGLDLSQIQRRSDANKLLGEVLEDDELRLFLLQNLLIKPGEESRWRINLQAIRANVNHLVQFEPQPRLRFSKATDVIRGAQSGYVRDAYFPKFRDLFPNVNFHSIENAGHWPHAQNPTAFLAKINELFAR